MDGLEKLIADKTGISEEQAHTASETALGFVKDKLPSGLSGMMDSLMGHHTAPNASADTDETEDTAATGEEDEPAAAEEEQTEDETDSDDHEEQDESEAEHEQDDEEEN